ncbi:hypothetical protein ALP96_102706, partial [Pseudomonas savastanoi pv. glycinea]
KFLTVSRRGPASRAQPSRSTVNGLTFSARRVPNTPAPPTSRAPITGSSNSHGCGCHSSEKA